MKNRVITLNIWMLVITVMWLPFSAFYSFAGSDGITEELNQTGMAAMEHCKGQKNHCDTFSSEAQPKSKCCTQHCDASFGASICPLALNQDLSIFAEDFRAFTLPPTPDPLPFWLLRPPKLLS